MDTSQLTGRERTEWWAHVSELLAPCPQVAASIAECVSQARACSSCRPAAEFLASQVRLGRTHAQVESAFRLRFDPETVRAVDVTGSPAKGPADAPVTLVEWADFECPFCVRTAPELEFAAQAFPNHVRFVFKHFPLTQHVHALDAARAAVAAQRQGRFWPLHDLMYANAEQLDPKGLTLLEQKVGLDLGRMDVEIGLPEVQAVIDRDKKQADQLGLKGTPMIYINGRYFDLDYFDPGADLEPWIALEIELATGKKVEPVKVNRQAWPPDFQSAQGAPPAPTPNSHPLTGAGGSN